MKRWKLIVLLQLICSFSYAQGEYIIEIDPTTGSYVQPTHAIDSVTWVIGYARTYDEIHGYYIFNSSSPNKLITVNSNDSIIFNPASPAVSECQYDNSAGILYGLSYPSAGQFVFASVNPVTANYTQIGSGPIPGMGGTMQGFSTFDKNNHRYIILASGNQLISIDAPTGTVLTNTTAVFNTGDGIVHLCFDETTNKLYGLVQNSGLQKCFLVSIDLVSGIATRIGSGVNFGFGGGTSAIDKLNHYYIYDYSSSGYYIAVLDISTGNAVYNNLVPFGSGDNINSIAYDNTKKKLYAEHWDADGMTGIRSYDKNLHISIYPNPGFGAISINTAQNISEIKITNLLGQIISETKPNSQKTEIKIEEPGVYFINIAIGKEIITKKVIILEK